MSKGTDVQGSVFVYSRPVCGKPGAVLVLTEVRGGAVEVWWNSEPFVGSIKALL